MIHIRGRAKWRKWSCNFNVEKRKLEVLNIFGTYTSAAKDIRGVFQYGKCNLFHLAFSTVIIVVSEKGRAEKKGVNESGLHTCAHVILLGITKFRNIIILASLRRASKILNFKCVISSLPLFKEKKILSPYDAYSTSFSNFLLLLYSLVPYITQFWYYQNYAAN